MYAFCVLELEMHSNKVSIKKQQQAIQKVLSEQQKDGEEMGSGGDGVRGLVNKSQLQLLDQSETNETNGNDFNHPRLCNDNNDTGNNNPSNSLTSVQLCPSSSLQTTTLTNGTGTQPPTIASPQQRTNQNLQIVPHHSANGDTRLDPITADERDNNSTDDCNQSGVEGKTLLQLQQEVAMSRKCYSDYQKTQVLTSSMLRDVQKRFAKYYPDSAIPSRTTIKHVFEKCVAHGTVENIKTPRKATKIPQGDEIEYLLIKEPQLSLRQLAQKLNVSTGTVSRRCKALGLIPESVTIKHQQMASARRQKQMKQLESQTVKAIEQGSVRTDETNGQDH